MTDDSIKNNRVALLQTTMLALSYMESKFFGDGSVAELIEETSTHEQLFYGLCGVSTTFTMHTSELANVTPAQAIENVRQSVMQLIVEATKDDSQYFD
jgi:hypothetical protein